MRCVARDKVVFFGVLQLLQRLCVFLSVFPRKVTLTRVRKKTDIFAQFYDVINIPCQFESDWSINFKKCSKWVPAALNNVFIHTLISWFPGYFPFRRIAKIQCSPCNNGPHAYKHKTQLDDYLHIILPTNFAISKSAAVTALKTPTAQ